MYLKTMLPRPWFATVPGQDLPYLVTHSQNFLLVFHECVKFYPCRAMSSSEEDEGGQNLDGPLDDGEIVDVTDDAKVVDVSDDFLDRDNGNDPT